MIGFSARRRRRQRRSHFCAASSSMHAVLVAAAFLGTQPYGNAATIGAIGGEVTFIGAIPKRAPIPVTKDQDYCGKTLADESYVIGPRGGLKNVVVYIEQAPLSQTPAGEEKDNLLENRACRFVPRVMAMRWGERLVVKNSDPKLHIVHSYFEKRTVFNLSLPFRGQGLDVTRKIKGPGLLQVNCDTHGWMRGYIHVFGHPFFAVTDENGAFTITNIPHGRYTLKAWHEEGGLRNTEITVPESGQVRVSFEFGK